MCPIPDGGFCVADRSNNRLQFFTASGDHLLSYPSVQEMGEEMPNSDDPGKFNRPAGVAFTNVPVQAIIVADKDNHRIQVRSFILISLNINVNKIKSLYFEEINKFCQD